MPDKMMKRGGMSDSGLNLEPGALTARGGMDYMAPIPAPESAAYREARKLAMQRRAIPDEQDMNRPAMDINDAFFGPDRKRFDIVEFITNLIGGR